MPIKARPRLRLNSSSAYSVTVSAERKKPIFRQTRTHIEISFMTTILAREASLNIFDIFSLDRTTSFQRLINSMAVS